MPRHFISCIIVALSAIIILLPENSLARENTSVVLEKKVEKQQQKIKRVQKDIEGHKEMVRSSRTKEINLLGQLEIIDQSLASGRDKLASLKKQVAGQEKLIHQKTEELKQIEAEKENIKSHVKKRLAAFYRMGDMGFMNVTFSTSNLPDLLNFKEYFMALIRYDQQVIDQYREKITALISSRELLQQEKDALLKVIVDVKKQESQLATTRRERMVLLARVNTEKKLYQRALEEMEEATVRLTETLIGLREKLVESRHQQRQYSSPKKRRPGSYSGFATLKGKLIPPARGSVTTYFGKNTQGKFGIETYANGIDIKTLAGAEIYAIYNGTVVYAGQLRGYGNLIIIDHGQQYYSLISRASEFYKKEGNTVNTGEVIGVMSDQGGLLGEGLHFEVRRGTEPENPLDWINKGLLKFDAQREASKQD